MITASISSNNLKLVQTGKKIYKEISLDASLVKGSKILNQEQLAQTLGAIASENKLSGEKVVFGLSQDNVYLLTAKAKGEKDYLSAVNKVIQDTVPHPLEELLVTTKVVGKEGEQQVIQVVAAQKKLLSGYAESFKAGGMQITRFVPLPLALVASVKDSQKPYLIVCNEGNEASFILVGEQGTILFSATYPSDNILKSTEEVVKFISDKYQSETVRKILICGDSYKSKAQELKTVGLVVAALELEPEKFCKLAALAKYDDNKLSLSLNGGSQAALLDKLPKLGTLLAKKRSSGQEANEKTTTPPPPDKPSADNPPEPSDLGVTYLKKPQADQELKDRIGKILPLIGIGLLLLGCAGATVYFFTTRAKDSQTDNQETTSTPTTTPYQESESEKPQPKKQASPAAEKRKPTITREDYSIQVLNGSGVEGAAGQAANLLSEAGWAEADTSNAESYDFEETIIEVKKSAQDAVETVKEDLGEDYQPEVASEYLPEDSAYDIVVTVGKS